MAFRAEIFLFFQANISHNSKHYMALTLGGELIIQLVKWGQVNHNN